jgi:hypothetical protein
VSNHQPPTTNHQRNAKPQKQNCGLVLKFGVWICFGVWCLVFGVFTGCQTQPLPPVNLSEAGWRLREGQAVWRPKKELPEIAGELRVAANQNGSSWLQFSKEPFPIVIAQLSPRQWQVQFVPQNKSYSFRGKPSAKISWFQLLKSLAGEKVESPWRFQKTGAENWRLENAKSGESLEGFLSPGE